MKQTGYILFIGLMLLSSCNSFEKRFYNSIDTGQVNAIRNGSDTFDLSSITDFDWDSVILIRGNESVPVFKEEIEEMINSCNSNIDWEDRRFNDMQDLNLIYKTEDLPINRDRFYFMTPERKIIEKEIESGINIHNPAFELQYCLVDTTRKGYWLSRGECRFTLKSNVSTAGEGTMFLYPNCLTK